MPVCDRCGKEGATRQRMNTQYHDDESNWTVQCAECIEVTNEEWQDRWNDYYRGMY